MCVCLCACVCANERESVCVFVCDRAEELPIQKNVSNLKHCELIQMHEKEFQALLIATLIVII